VTVSEEVATLLRDFIRNGEYTKALEIADEMVARCEDPNRPQPRPSESNPFVVFYPHEPWYNQRPVNPVETAQPLAQEVSAVVATRDQRVRDFIRELHGKDPEPLRSYITREEAFGLMSRHPATVNLTKDLNLSGYSGKWKQAVEDSIRLGLKPGDFDFWDKARTAFLEYGGEFQKVK
jgi:hypothetical protein